MKQTPGVPVLSVENVTFAYASEPVLEDVTFQVNRGEFVGLVGPNGSGKTTLLKIILGLAKPDSGKVSFFGCECEGCIETGPTRIGYVAQKAASFQAGFPATAAEVVASGLLGRRIFSWRASAEERAAIDRALGMVGMAGKRDQLVGKLSGGQQQRVFIARALVSKPDLLIMDEPTVGVDPGAQEQFYALIRQLRKEMGLTVLLVSHDIGVVTAEVTQLACLNRRIHFHGAPQDFDPALLNDLYGHKVAQVHHHHH